MNLKSFQIGKKLANPRRKHRILAKVDELMTLCDRLVASLTTAGITRRLLLVALLHEALDPAARALEAAE